MLSPLLNSESTIFLVNICYDFFFNNFNWLTEKLFWTNKKFVYSFNCSKWEKFVEKIRGKNSWTKLVKKSHEFVIWISVKLALFSFKNID